MYGRGLIRIGYGLVDTPQVSRLERLAQVCHGLFELAHMLGQWLQWNLWGRHRVLVGSVLRHPDAGKNDWHQEFHAVSDPAYRISAQRRWRTTVSDGALINCHSGFNSVQCTGSYGHNEWRFLRLRLSSYLLSSCCRGSPLRRECWQDAKVIAASDFFVAVAAPFRTLYVFVVVEIRSRRILHYNGTAHPTAEWTLHQFREALPGDHRYRFRHR
jgi:hypothetical protein